MHSVVSKHKTLNQFKKTVYLLRGIKIMAFIKEIPAFSSPESGIEPLQDKIDRGENFNSIPGDSGLLHSGTPRKNLTFREAANNSVIQHYGSYIVMGSDRLGHLGQGAGASGFTNILLIWSSVAVLTQTTKR